MEEAKGFAKAFFYNLESFYFLLGTNESLPKEPFKIINSSSEIAELLASCENYLTLIVVVGDI